jgi:hypothetical protein
MFITLLWWDFIVDFFFNRFLIILQSYFFLCLNFNKQTKQTYKL